MSTALAPTTAIEPKAVVLFDGDCGFCQRSVRILQRLDWLGKLDCRNARDPAVWPAAEQPLLMERMLEEMHVVTPDGSRTHAGFSAFRWMSWRMPPTIPLAPLLYVPGMLWLGNRVYRWIARNRYSLIPCDNGACQVPLRKPGLGTDVAPASPPGIVAE